MKRDIAGLAQGDSIVYLQVFLYLQVLDFLTTSVGLRLGVQEASPVVRWLTQFGPTVGLFVSKVLAVSLAWVCVRIDRQYLVEWLNYWYASLVIWNLSVILFSRTAL